MHNNYQMPDCYSTEQKQLVVLDSEQYSYSSDLKHKLEIAKFKIIEVKFVPSQNC